MSDLCSDIELLAAYIDNNVTDQEQSRVDAHLVVCDRCLELVAVVIASKIAIPDPEPPKPKLN